MTPRTRVGLVGLLRTLPILRDVEALAKGLNGVEEDDRVEAVFGEVKLWARDDGLRCGHAVPEVHGSAVVHDEGWLSRGGTRVRMRQGDIAFWLYRSVGGDGLNLADAPGT